VSELLDIREAAEMLKVAPDTLRAWRRRRQRPPYHRLGIGGVRLIRYRRKEIEKWISEQGVTPGGE